MKAMIILFDGVEEIEAFTTIDVLRRAGIELTTIGLTSSIIETAQNIKITADKKLAEINQDSFDILIIPGGKGYTNMLKSSAIINLVKKFNEQNKTISAICAGPIILEKAGILEHKTATCYPGLERNLPRPRADRVVVDGNIITSRGPGTAMEFALKIVEVVKGKDVVQRLKEVLVV